MSQQALPVLELLPEIQNIFSKENCLILQAPPGAGKSTVLPLQLLNSPWLNGQKIMMLEPRKIAATSVAKRMAFLLNEPVGNTVGYKVRFDQKISNYTKIEVVTEGILTRKLQQDNSLEGIGLIIFDEFHERSLQADLSLAFCRELQQVLREDLRILIMSATLEGDQLSTILNNAPVLTSQGRQYPIKIEYATQESDEPLTKRIEKYILKSINNDTGDILTFLPGAGEILKVKEALEKESMEFVVYPLYGDLSFEKQQEAILPHSSGKRKVVLATSIAETSLTIEGIRIVIDSGLARVPRFDPNSGFSKLVTIAVTKDAADQRAGRAGRLGPGIAYRLWTSYAHLHLKPSRTPEILEADLAGMILEVANWGTTDILNLSWITPPSPGSIPQATELLNKLEALENNKITERGKEMLQLPTHPRIAHLLLEGKRVNLLALATDVAAVLEERDPLSKGSGANICLRVQALRKWRSKQFVSADRGILERIGRLAEAWRKVFKINEENIDFKEEDAGRLVAAAYPERIAKQKDRDQRRFRLSSGRSAIIEDHDPLTGEQWLSVAQLDGDKNEGKIYLAAPLNIQDLRPFMHLEESVNWDQERGILVGRIETKIQNLLVDSVPIEKIPENIKIKILCEVVRSEGFKIFNYSEDILNWQQKIESLRVWEPQRAWPDVSEHFLLNTIEAWLSPFLITVRKKEDFKRLDLAAILLSILPWELQGLAETLAPSGIKVPTGSVIPLKYQNNGQPPVLAVRLQEMFGLADTPVINEGKIKVMLHLLSPGYRPVQVTQDLKSFWNTTYNDVRKELRARYPKHHWPEDPWTAEAVRGVKRKK